RCESGRSDSTAIACARRQYLPNAPVLTVLTVAHLPFSSRDKRNSAASSSTISTPPASSPYMTSTHEYGLLPSSYSCERSHSLKAARRSSPAADSSQPSLLPSGATRKLR